MNEIDQQIQAAIHIGKNLTYGIPLLDMFVGIEEHLSIDLDGGTNEINVEILTTDNVALSISELYKIDPTPLIVGQFLQTDGQMVEEAKKYIQSSAQLQRWVRKYGLSHAVIQTIVEDWDKANITNHQS